MVCDGGIGHFAEIVDVAGHAVHADVGHLGFGYVPFADFPEGGDDEGHQGGFVGEGAHLRGVLEEDAAAFADGYPPGRTVSMERVDSLNEATVFGILDREG